MVEHRPPGEVLLVYFVLLGAARWQLLISLADLELLVILYETKGKRILLLRVCAMIVYNKIKVVCLNGKN